MSHAHIFKLGLTMLLAAVLVAVPGYGTDQGISLSQFFDYVNILSVTIAPDGNTLIVSTKRPDWNRNRYRFDLWIVREGKSPELLTHSGQDSDPLWSPDGRWVAFTSDRQPSAETANDGNLYVISPEGGEAIPVATGGKSVHAFAWSPDSKKIYFSISRPQSKKERSAKEKEWKDVVRYREDNRGDIIAYTTVAQTMADASATHTTHSDEQGDQDMDTPSIPKEMILAELPVVIDDIVVSHDGKQLAVTTAPSSHREEDPNDDEIYVIPATAGHPRQLTRNEMSEGSISWSRDDKSVFFTGYGEAVGRYRHVQERIYEADVATGTIRRWASTFNGAVGGGYRQIQNGSIVTTAVEGTQTQVYSETSISAPLDRISSNPGTYTSMSLAEHSPKVAFIFSAWGKPAEVYLADDLQHIKQAKLVTQFNSWFAQQDLPKGKPYRWTAPDGTEIEGVLIYPPDKFGEKHLPMLTLIHGGPANADGDRFRADWYDWSVLAATRGYLVFRPNYRGSTGYGDKFLQQISPQIVSLPGSDILAGVDALVKDGIADPDRLAIGGYSYGGFLTNWLITQTTRFKAALTGAGAVEHVAEWGNDDLPFGDAWYLGGLPWEAEKNYTSEAAIFQLQKVKTPTHIVGGARDVRVYIGEQYLLERALHTLGVPDQLLIFPGEGHLLTRDPWHGRIKVREELLWLERYCPSATESSHVN